MTNKQINNSKSLFGTPLKNYAKGKKEEKKSINQSNFTHFHSSIGCLLLQILCDTQNGQLIQEFLPVPFCY